MQKENSLIVLTNVTYNKQVYQKYCFIIENILKRYNIQIIKEEKLSLYVKDYFFHAPEKTICLIKKYFKINNHCEADICIQKNIYRQKKIIACDMDMTVINVESINLIAKHLLRNNDMENLTKLAMSGDIKFRESILLRTKKLKGLSVEQIIPLLKSIKYSPGILEVIKTMNKNGSHTMLISGGYDLIANLIGKKIGFKEIISNQLKLKKDIITGELKNDVIDKEGKLRKFKKRIKENKIKIPETIAVGDGDNDIAMIQYSGLGIAWNAYPKVQKAADIALSKNFKSILYFQGLKEKEFIT